jgi:hypothetical protein
MHHSLLGSTLHNLKLERATDRGLIVPDRIRFILGDVETLNDALDKAALATENLFDVCISNGAFCLVPDKRKALEKHINNDCV